MKYRVDLNFIGVGNSAIAYGGKLEAWSFINVEGEEWFSDFRQHILSSMGKKYLPVYRMADGEYRFLMGRKYNLHKKPLWKEILAVTAEKLRIKNPDKWKTSWGEEYKPKETRQLRKKLSEQIREISEEGFLSCYINDNGLNAFIEFNKHIESYFIFNKIKFTKDNYIPFHFTVGLLTNDGWEEFYLNRNLLVVSGTNDLKEQLIKTNILNLGAKSVNFLRISETESMKEQLDLTTVNIRPDLCLVAAGIGSANILTQLAPLNTVALDIGGYINCFIDIKSSQHGGVFKYPLNIKSETRIFKN